MSTLAIVGAGPGLGFSIARRFGAEGFDVGLVSRSQQRLDELAGQLQAEGIHAAGFAADVTDPGTVTSALDRIESRLGAIDVLEYSPAARLGTPDLAPVDAIHVTVENLRPQVEYYLYGGVSAIGHVLPAMIERGSGTILVTTGASSGPAIHPPFANIAAGSGALRNWVLNLHQALTGTGVYAAHIAIAVWIGAGAPEAEPDVIAERYWELYRTRETPELFYQALPAK